MDMSNTAIRKWCRENGMTANAVGNVAPEFVAAYLAAHTAPEKAPKKEKGMKKEKAKKATKKVAEKGNDLAAEFGEIFSAGTIKHVAAQHPERAHEILTKGQAFLANGIRSRYVAIQKAIAGEEVKIKAEKPAGTSDKPKAGKDKPKAQKAASVAPSGGYAVILPTGATIMLATEGEADKIAALVPGAIKAPVI